MYVKHFYDTDLAQGSYLIGCQATGEAVVVDPRRDVQVYLAEAERQGFRIIQVTETHIHADYPLRFTRACCRDRRNAVPVWRRGRGLAVRVW